MTQACTPIKNTTSSLAFDVDIKELRSPSSGSARQRLEERARTPQKTVTAETLEVKLDSASKKKKDLELEKKEKAKETVLRAQKLAYDIKEKEEMKRRELERILAEDVAAAEEKKNSLLELRLERASSDVMRAKELANLKRLEESDASEKIRRSLEDSLAIAEENKQCYLSEIRLKAGMKNEHVRDVAQSMKEQQEWTARQKIEQLVEAMRVAEMKKNEHLMERSSKGGQVYYRAKEVAYCMKEIERLEAEKLAKELQTELIDAAAARDDIDKLRHDKVKDKLRRVEALKQERRLSGASFESPYPGITTSP